MGTCPSAEELACYIDGALSPEQRARVAEHLASCESCFEVYSEVLQFQLESEQAPLGKVVQLPLGEKRIPAAAWWSSRQPRHSGSSPAGLPTRSGCSAISWS